MKKQKLISDIILIILIILIGISMILTSDSGCADNNYGLINYLNYPEMITWT